MNPFEAHIIKESSLQVPASLTQKVMQQLAPLPGHNRIARSTALIAVCAAALIGIGTIGIGMLFGKKMASPRYVEISDDGIESLSYYIQESYE